MHICNFEHNTAWVLYRLQSEVTGGISVIFV